MSHRLFSVLPLISATLLACTAILWPWSFWTDPRRDCLSFSDDFHGAVQYGRVSFFNVKEYGPYHGSIISLGDGREFAEQRGFGDTAGIYYRYFRWADSGAVLWTLSVSLAYPLVGFAVLPLVWAWKRSLSRRRDKGDSRAS